MRKRRIIGPEGQPVEATELTFQNAHEHWNEYLLDDGSLVKLKPVATEVFRIDGRYDPEGNPVYVIKSTNIVIVNAPDNLKQKKGDQP